MHRGREDNSENAGKIAGEGSHFENNKPGKSSKSRNLSRQSTTETTIPKVEGPSNPAATVAAHHAFLEGNTRTTPAPTSTTTTTEVAKIIDTTKTNKQSSPTSNTVNPLRDNPITSSVASSAVPPQPTHAYAAATDSVDDPNISSEQKEIKDATFTYRSYPLASGASSPSMHTSFNAADTATFDSRTAGTETFHDAVSEPSRSTESQGSRVDNSDATAVQTTSDTLANYQPHPLGPISEGTAVSTKLYQSYDHLKSSLTHGEPIGSQASTAEPQSLTSSTANTSDLNNATPHNTGRDAALVGAGVLAAGTGAGALAEKERDTSAAGGAATVSHPAVIVGAPTAHPDQGVSGVAQTPSEIQSNNKPVAQSHDVIPQTTASHELSNKEQVKHEKIKAKEDKKRAKAIAKEEEHREKERVKAEKAAQKHADKEAKRREKEIVKENKKHDKQIAEQEKAAAKEGKHKRKSGIIAGAGAGAGAAAVLAANTNESTSHPTEPTVSEHNAPSTQADLSSQKEALRSDHHEQKKEIKEEKYHAGENHHDHKHHDKEAAAAAAVAEAERKHQKEEDNEAVAEQAQTRGSHVADNDEAQHGHHHHGEHSKDKHHGVLGLVHHHEDKEKVVSSTTQPNEPAVLATDEHVKHNHNHHHGDTSTVVGGTALATGAVAAATVEAHHHENAAPLTVVSPTAAGTANQPLSHPTMDPASPYVISPTDRELASVGGAPSSRPLTANNDTTHQHGHEIASGVPPAAAAILGVTTTSVGANAVPGNTAAPTTIGQASTEMPTNAANAATSTSPTSPYVLSPTDREIAAVGGGPTAQSLESHMKDDSAVKETHHVAPVAAVAGAGGAAAALAGGHHVLHKDPVSSHPEQVPVIHERAKSISNKTEEKSHKRRSIFGFLHRDKSKRHSMAEPVSKRPDATPVATTDEVPRPLSQAQVVEPEHSSTAPRTEAQEYAEAHGTTGDLSSPTGNMDGLGRHHTKLHKDPPRKVRAELEQKAEELRMQSPVHSPVAQNPTY